MKPLKILGLTLGVGVALYLVIVIFLAVDPLLGNYMNRTTFNSTQWKNWKENETEMFLRWDMLHDLEENYKLNELNQSEIIDLLGEPETKSTSAWIYDLGQARHGKATGTFTIDFEEGKVKRLTKHRG